MAAFGLWLSQGLHAQPLGASGGVSRLPGGSAGAVHAEGRLARAALAPSATLARQLAR